VETIGSKRSYALIWCMPNNDDDDVLVVLVGANASKKPRAPSLQIESG